MGDPASRCIVVLFNTLFLRLVLFISLLLFFWVPCAVKRRPKFKSRYKQRVQVAIEYAKSIDDFDDLVNPHTLALYCLGPEPSAYVLRTIEREEKKSEYLVRHFSSFSFFFFFFFYKIFLFFFFFFRDDD